MNKEEAVTAVRAWQSAGVKLDDVIIDRLREIATALEIADAHSMKKVDLITEINKVARIAERTEVRTIVVEANRKSDFEQWVDKTWRKFFS